MYGQGVRLGHATKTMFVHLCLKENPHKQTVSEKTMFAASVNITISGVYLIEVNNCII